MDAELQALQEQIRCLTERHGGAAVQSALAGGLLSQDGVRASASPPGTPRARRSRPPVRYSPDTGAERRAHQRSRSPQRRRPAREQQETGGGEERREERVSRATAGRGRGSEPAARLPPRVPPASTALASPAAAIRGGRRGSQGRSHAGSREDQDGGRSPRGGRRAGSDGGTTSGTSPSGAPRMRGRASVAGVMSSAGRPAAEEGRVTRSQRRAATARPQRRQSPAAVQTARRTRSRSPARSPAIRDPHQEEREEGEYESPDGDEKDLGPAAVPGCARGQPGERTSLSVLSCTTHTLSDSVGRQGPGGVSGGLGAGSDSVALLGQFLGLLQGVLGARGAGPGVAAGAPTAAWTGETVVAGVGDGGQAAASAASPPPSQEVTGQDTGSAGGGSKQAKDNDGLRLDDRAKGEVYVCFEGPLGAHLKQEVRDKIWKGEYVEIFSLLPLEKFHLDKVKPDESKKEEEEKRRYRLIPRTFSNWLQAFAILASVIGEKEPNNCSALFCYMDSVGEAYRTYGGQNWLRYDEQFRQRKAVRPGIRWDHKDIALWMRLMAAPAGQPFRGGAGGSGNAPGASASQKKGYCWLFNEGQCKFGSTCRFKHECSGCGGAHSLSKCFKRSKSKGGEGVGKREDPGENRGDGAVSK